MPIRMSPVMYEPVSMRGGMDLITPTMNLPGGVCRDAINFECVETGGYRRIAGYERFSGQTKPSTAVYGTLFFAAFVNTPVAGDTITNGTASAVVIAVGPNYVAYTKLAGGSFAVGNTITVGASTVGVSIVPTDGIASALDARYTALAADEYRGDIAAPTGSGPIRSVFVFNDISYCIRDNAGATAAVLYKSSSSGWQAVTLGHEVSFTAGGTATPVQGQTLTQGGVTAVIQRVVLESGAWTGTAAGRFIIATPSGGNFAAGAATVSTSGATVTLSGVQTQISLLPGGKGSAVQANFFGQASGARIYHSDGVNRMFEFDGTVLVPLSTSGLIPRHVAVTKQYLWYSVGSSIFARSVGDPYLTTGGVEIPVGDNVLALLNMAGSQSGAALAVFTRGSIHILYGSGSSDWNLVPYSMGGGALEYTAQNGGIAMMTGDQGIFSLSATLAFGNFQQNTLSQRIGPFMEAHRPYVSCSGLVRAKSQYRLFYSDGWAVFMTIVNGKLVGAMPAYMPTYMNVQWESTLSTGAPIILCGGGDGLVYEMERGTSFDGAPINWLLQLNWASMSNPRILKRMRKAALEVFGSSYLEVSFGYLLGYGSADILQADNAQYSAALQGTNWDSAYWDSVFWDASTLIPIELEMTGSGENVQAIITGSSADFQPFVINSLIYHYTPRRGLR